MKIGIDARCLSGGKRSGVEEYLLNLLPEIFELDKKNEYIVFFNSFKKIEVDFSWMKKFSNVSLKKFSFPNKIFNFLLWYFSCPKLDKLLGGVDYFFMPNISFSAFSKKTKLILTIHDLSFERYSEFFSPKRRLWHLFLNPKKLIRKAHSIIAISQSTQEDLEKLYRVKKEKIKVIPNGISKKFQFVDRNNPKLIEAKEKYGLPFKFILYFGTQEPRKNINSLILAFNELRKEALKENHEGLKSFKLVLAGNPGWSEKNTQKLIQNSPFKKDIIQTGFVREEDKIYVYNLASVLVYPSFFEGFGFPPLEAQACQLPTIVSANSSFFEISGNSSFLVDQDRPQEIKEALKKIILNKKNTQKIIEKGKINSEKFSWKENAKNWLTLIEKK